MKCRSYRFIFLCPLLSSFLIISAGNTFSDELDFFFDLPRDHSRFFLNRRSDLRKRCLDNSSCPFKHVQREESQSKKNSCFGYETNCDFSNSTSYSYGWLRCPEESNWYTARTKEQQMRTFWTQGDFGYLKERLRNLETICAPDTASSQSTSWLVCSDHLRYCYARNIFIDFRKLKSKEHSDRYREGVLEKGDIGGNCKMNANLLRNRADERSPLQSWTAELSNFATFPNFTFDQCDLVYEKPVIFMKLDAGISMYHHFCDFVNLYASLHMNGSFHRDVHIIQWDTSSLPYTDLFEDTWNVFTDLPLIHLKELDGKKVCFRQAMFPLLARMIFGLYYNMPLIGGCVGSGLIHAFSEHVLHRLRLHQTGPRNDGRLRVTFLSRSTKYRRILNEDELVNGLKTFSELEISIMDYAHLPFLAQLNQTVNTDIFIAMHGSGLTHLLFLPDWAAVFEIYNCEDVNCYWDLARLRGVDYFTWERRDKLQPEDEGHHPTLGAHAKFTNYYFDLDEFLRIVEKIVANVKGHERYKKAMQRGAKDQSKIEL